MSQWADLPKELIESIGKCLDSPVDVLRCRSVCKSWRCYVAVPSFDQEIPYLILKIPQPIRADAILVQSTVCRIEFANQNSNSSSCSMTKGWLTKIGESRYGKLKLQNPLSDKKIRYPLLNLLDTNFTQLSKGFMLKHPSGHPVYGVNKVVLFPISEKHYSKNEIGILAIFHEGKLGYWKYGHDNWTLLDDTNFQYDDIIEYKGQIYVVDTWGKVSWIDSSLKLIQYSPPLFGCGEQKHLVESCGDLYVVDRYLDGKRITWKDYHIFDDVGNNIPIRHRRYRKCNPNAIDFRVHKLDEDWGKWVDVKSLEDRAFVLGVDCNFSISCSDFAGGKGNCIYFTEDDNYLGRGLSNDCIRVFRLEDHSIEKIGALPEYSEVFWPPDTGSEGTNLAQCSLSYFS
ncbi:hypothetical protein JCGZ_22346 [Jatropha curcas]|uniref:F-box domain-containing protein n=1 Tax=Jatropha curcas TaxID=180498 RepID=A0A067LHR7_JATCU|nr:putative F-box protein At1g65770 [Jatropha curcas]KDP43719.1 hypothetical protein JCGZ_22346 [Jatropha curcas]